MTYLGIYMALMVILSDNGISKPSSTTVLTYDIGRITTTDAMKLEGKRARFHFRFLPNQVQEVLEGDVSTFYGQMKNKCLVIVCRSGAGGQPLPTDIYVEAMLHVEKGVDKDHVVYRLKNPIWQRE